MIPAINVNNAVKEGEERKESQQPLISSPKRPAPARSHVIPDLRGPCHDRNRDITPLLRREVPERPAPLVGAASACGVRRCGGRAPVPQSSRKNPSPNCFQ